MLYFLIQSKHLAIVISNGLTTMMKLNGYTIILHYANIANNKIYQFKLHYTSDNIQYSDIVQMVNMIYHVDIGSGRNSLRKLSCSILLNDPNEFEGGDFEFQVGKHPEKDPIGKR